MIWKLEESGRGVNKELYWYLSEGAEQKLRNPVILVEIQNQNPTDESLER
jgi:hypothetical protein